MSHSVIASTALSSQDHHYCFPPRFANLPVAPTVISQLHISVTSSLQATVTCTLDINSDEQIHSQSTANYITLLPGSSSMSQWIPNQTWSKPRSLQTGVFFVTVDVCVHLQFEYGLPWGMLVQQQFVSGILSCSWSKKSPFGPISIMSHSAAFRYNQCSSSSQSHQAAFSVGQS